MPALPLVRGYARAPPEPMITEQQYRRLMNEYQKTGEVSRV